MELSAAFFTGQGTEELYVYGKCLSLITTQTCQHAEQLNNLLPVQRDLIGQALTHVLDSFGAVQQAALKLPGRPSGQFVLADAAGLLSLPAFSQQTFWDIVATVFTDNSFNVAIGSIDMILVKPAPADFFLLVHRSDSQSWAHARTENAVL